MIFRRPANLIVRYKGHVVFDRFFSRATTRDCYECTKQQKRRRIFVTVHASKNNFNQLLFYAIFLNIFVVGNAAENLKCQQIFTLSCHLNVHYFCSSLEYFRDIKELHYPTFSSDATWFLISVLALDDALEIQVRWTWQTMGTSYVHFHKIFRPIFPFFCNDCLTFFVGPHSCSRR